MLKPRKRITKKELKEDKLVTFYVKANRWLETYRKYFFLALAVVAVIVVAIVLSNRARNRAELHASEFYLKGTTEFEKGDYQAAADQFQVVLNEYGGTSYGKLSRLFLGNCYTQLGRRDEALAMYDSFVARYKKDPNLRAAGMAGKAALLEESGEYAKSAALFEQIAVKFPDAILGPTYLMSAAQNY
ncbi:tetratricopeptide repeat protein, partial [candidate division KSB1 bacterium]|nr:tetratricopeptide repeat protein [candidate division KSB1 bacterium]